MSTPQDDTQPLAPLPTEERQPARARPERRRSTARRDNRNCLYQVLAALALLLLALLIVVLAGLAGWTAGQQDAQDVIAVTQAARLRDQLGRIPGDVAAGNTQLLQARLDFFADMTPAVPQLPQLRQTATALARPTLTFTPGPTFTPTITATVVAPQTVAWDPEDLLRQGREAIGSGDYEEGVDLLQALEALEPDYASVTVRELILNGLTRQAQRLFRSGDRLAEAILVTDEAIRYGLSADSGLRYERYMAALYLDARSQISRGPAAAIPALRELYDVAPGYRGGELPGLIAGQHAAWAEQLLTGGDPCAAHEQLQQALVLRADAAMAQRRDEANLLCQQGVGLPGQQPPAGATLEAGAYIGPPVGGG